MFGTADDMQRHAWFRKRSRALVLSRRGCRYVGHALLPSSASPSGSRADGAPATPARAWAQDNGCMRRSAVANHVSILQFTVLA